jgi:hypothetical protein
MDDKAREALVTCNRAHAPGEPTVRPVTRLLYDDFPDMVGLMRNRG